VFRWDYLKNPSDATGDTRAYDENRYTFGLNYWFNSSTAIKAAYQIDNVRDPQKVQEGIDKFMMQMAIGF